MRRYDISVTAWKEEDSKGEFVRFEDAQAEIERLNKACDQRAAHEYKLMGEIDALKAQNAELLAAQQWRDIESAPRDGTRILVAVEVHVLFGQSYWQIDSVCVDEGTGEICDEDYRGWSDLSDYSHWMPEPLPPAIAKARGDL